MKRPCVSNSELAVGLLSWAIPEAMELTFFAFKNPTGYRREELKHERSFIRTSCEAATGASN
jgi:hypothetical protein